MKEKVAFYTLGCKVNAYETNAMMQIFRQKGYEIVDFNEIADIYIVNTCTVTNMSDRKSRQILRRAKQKNPKSILCAVGCYAQVAKEELLKIEDIDIVLGTVEKKDIWNKIQEYRKQNDFIEKSEKRKIAEKIEDKTEAKNREEKGEKEIIQKNRKLVEAENIMKLRPYDSFEGVAYSEHARAEIKIQDGCDRFCTYCIIPYARGPVRSRKPEEIIQEIQNIVASGVQEIVITGIHISSYGKDFAVEEIQKWSPEKASFTLMDLLEKVQLVDGVKRIRLGSLEPRIITKDFVNRLQKLTKICNHFHLSLQSGCDKTLQRMNRKYTTEEFREIVNLLREKIPEVALTTDIIVGFPGETEEEFKQTYTFLKEIQFSKMHIFKYSKRKGTPAANYPEQVEESQKDERSSLLLKMSAENEKAFAEKYIGKEIEVLFENAIEGHTTNYIKVIRKEKTNKKETKENIEKWQVKSEIQKVIPKKWEQDALIID